MPLDYSVDLALPILDRTPGVLRAMLAGLPDEWVRATDGPKTWSAFDVVGHLIHGEKTDWIPRVRHMLERDDSVPFTPFDREAMFTESRGKTIAALLDEFAALRAENKARLLDVLDKIERQAFEPRLGSHCAWCPVRAHCPAFGPEVALDLV